MEYNMFRKRTIVRTKEGVTVYDRMLSATRKTIFRLVFALAIACKITPTKLANAFDNDKTDDYAEKFSQKLLDKGKKEAEKMKKKLQKSNKLEDKKKTKSSK